MKGKHVQQTISQDGGKGAPPRILAVDFGGTKEAAVSDNWDRTWESFTMEIALELGLKGCDTLRKRDGYFLAENNMSKGKQVGKHNPTQQSDTSV